MLARHFFVPVIGPLIGCASSGALTPVADHHQQWWAAFRRIPLTEDEFAQIARNVAPYFTENSP